MEWREQLCIHFFKRCVLGWSLVVLHLFVCPMPQIFCTDHRNFGTIQQLDLELWGVHLWKDVSIYGEYVMSFVSFGLRYLSAATASRSVVGKTRPFMMPHLHDNTDQRVHFETFRIFSCIQWMIWYNWYGFVSLSQNQYHPKKSSSNINRPLSGLIPPKKINPLSMNPILKYSEPPTTLQKWLPTHPFHARHVVLPSEHPCVMVQQRWEVAEPLGCWEGGNI